MSARLRGIARQTQEIVEAGRYRAPGGHWVTIGGELSAAVEGTRMYGPGSVPVVPDTDRSSVCEVTGESSLDAARRLTSRAPDPVAVLNFASARNPGGGYLNGAQAQEEALCRASGLYTTLLRVPRFYEHHRADRSPFYSDRVIHSPGVPVFRDERGRLLDTPYAAGFLTSPAPNAGVILSRTPDEAARISPALASRAERVLETAAAAGYRRLVLGAWGCGVFRNDPAQVAGAFQVLLRDGGRFSGHFDEVVFAVLDRGQGQRTLEAFLVAFPERGSGRVAGARGRGFRAAEAVGTAGEVR
ncbi:TIGR02452 family protein [Streptomyces sp. NPDC019396]|uniref:TIGR02452 family protein n=1 Tax=Streptomyces sp. NPDC019396 TaxID=3154687 RepID=UPI003410AD6E